MNFLCLKTFYNFMVNNNHYSLVVSCLKKKEKYEMKWNIMSVKLMMINRSAVMLRYEL